MANGEIAMQRCLLLLILLAVPGLEGCIPIGVRAGTMPYALSTPFDERREIAQTADEHRRDAREQQRANLKTADVEGAAKAEQDGRRA
jgi:hypothetical protein